MTEDARQRGQREPVPASGQPPGVATSPGVGTHTDPAAAAAAARGATAASPDSGPPSAVGQRPEMLVGAAFAGSFLLARILKRLVD